METIDYIKKHRIIAIMRGLPREQLLYTAQALERGGIRLIEVTFDQNGAPETTAQAISALVTELGGSVCVGAGTVMSGAQLLCAGQAGAHYIISPDVNREIIVQTTVNGLVSMPGAFSPTEIAQAHRLGADIVKVFPSGIVGPEYIKAVRAPMSHIPLAAVGGVTLENARAFLDAGACCLGIGGCLVNMGLIRDKRYDELTKLAARFVRAIE